MVPGKYDLVIYRGGTYGFDAIGTDDVGEIDFAANYDKARMHIRPAWTRQAVAGQEPLFSLTTENGRLTLTDNSVEIAIMATDTSAMTFNSGVYTLELVIAGPSEAEDIVDILLQGKVIVKGEKTL